MEHQPETPSISSPPAGTAPAEVTRRRGRPRGPARPGDLRLEGHTTKSYALGDDAQRTVRYLRRIVNQRHVPDDATVAIGEGRITIEWSE